jgi:hypothetical protein
MPVDVMKRMEPKAWQNMPYFRQMDELEVCSSAHLTVCLSRHPLFYSDSHGSGAREERMVHALERDFNIRYCLWLDSSFTLHVFCFRHHFHFKHIEKESCLTTENKFFRASLSSIFTCGSTVSSLALTIFASVALLCSLFTR